ncbi:metalloregulator ArsR/SmtB family transcription factor [Emcibacter sp.]|uniref:ArsR/SmtB family transcription factor n=1 Tax=Emcibacter sp. TaxID=1979954 RepID=UPI002AA958B0|nr:metalloregulator ArsR/SmtB family transcription factor [Emcibacter sp.]
MKESTVVNMLSALAQETRLSLFRLLVKAGRVGMNAGTLADKLRTPNSTLSYHLSALEQAGLISSERQQRQIIYTANYEKLEKFLGFLVEDCCQGSGEICLSIEKDLKKVKGKK